MPPEPATLRPDLLAGRVVSAPEPWGAALAGWGAEPVPWPREDGGAPFDVVVGEADAAPVEEALDALWLRVQAVAAADWIGAGRDGAVLLVAPRPAAPDAAPLRAALENLARTLSIEWARHTIRTTTILPGDSTTDDEIAAVLGFLASPAAAYWSGCVVELGGAADRSQS